MAKESNAALYGWMLATAVAYFLILLSPLPSLLKFGGPLVMGFLLFVLVFSMRFTLGEVDADARTVLTGLGHKLRAARFRVQETDGELSVQVDSLSAIKIRARAGGSVARISYRMEGTPAGWAVTLILVISGYLTILLPPVVLVMLRHVRRFAREQVTPRLEAPEAPEATSVSVRIHEALVDSLSEGFRLSSEAYEAERSNYEDNVIVMIVIGIVAFMAGLTVLLAFNSYGGPIGVEASFVASIAMSCAIALVPIWLLRRRARPRLARLKGWATKLEVALANETSLTKPRDDDPSVFELLADAWKQVPEWLEIRRRSGLYRDPGTWLVIFVLAGLVFSGLTFALSNFSSDPWASAVAVALSGAVLYTMYILYSRSKKQLDEEEGRVYSNWNERLGLMNSRMERHLKEL